MSSQRNTTGPQTKEESSEYRNKSTVRVPGIDDFEALMSVLATSHASAGVVSFPAFSAKASSLLLLRDPFLQDVHGIMGDNMLLTVAGCERMMWWWVLKKTKVMMDKD